MKKRPIIQAFSIAQPVGPPHLYALDNHGRLINRPERNERRIRPFTQEPAKRSPRVVKYVGPVPQEEGAQRNQSDENDFELSPDFGDNDSFQ
jgi:hypothetical protein